MLLQETVCPICEAALTMGDARCVQCRCIVQFRPERYAFARSTVDEALVQWGIDRSRATLTATADDGAAHHVLGVCYVNLTLFDQGIDELRKAAQLLPERQYLRFELAVVLKSAGRLDAAREQAALALRAAPEARDYRYLDHFLLGAAANERGELRAAITQWLAAYDVDPTLPLAADVLGQFVTSQAVKLTNPIAHTLTGLSERDTTALRLLNSTPNGQRDQGQRAPRKPGELGRWSLGVLRKLSSARAAAVEQLHAEHLAAYRQRLEEFTAARDVADAQLATARQEWEVQVRGIRNDLPTMARLCLAVAEEQQRQAALAEQQRQAALAKQQQAAAIPQQRQAVASPITVQPLQQPSSLIPTKASRAKLRSYAVSAEYVQGLPVGKKGESVELVVSSDAIAVQRRAPFSKWDHTIPMEALAEVAVDTVKSGLSSTKCLRLSYRDARGMITHALFAKTKAEECVKQILRARANG